MRIRDNFFNISPCHGCPAENQSETVWEVEIKKKVTVMALPLICFMHIICVFPNTVKLRLEHQVILLVWISPSAMRCIHVWVCGSIKQLSGWNCNVPTHPLFQIAWTVNCLLYFITKLTGQFCHVYWGNLWRIYMRVCPIKPQGYCEMWGWKISWNCQLEGPQQRVT